MSFTQEKWTVCNPIKSSDEVGPPIRYNVIVSVYALMKI